LTARASPRIALFALSIIVAGLAASIYYWTSLLTSQAEVLRAAEKRNELRTDQLSIAVSQQFDATLRSADTALKHLRNVYVHDRRNFDLAARDVLETYPAGMFQFVTVAGSDGYLAYTSSDKTEHAYVGDLEHFRAHSDNSAGGNDKLFISKTFIGRTSGAPESDFA